MIIRPIHARPILFALLLALVAACAPKDDLKKPPVPLGRFLLGLNLVVTDSMQKSPVSRNATPEEWQTALKSAVQDRFGRYDGDTYYDMAINVVGYALAPPGVPIVLSPKSVLVVEVRVWYDKTQTQLNAEPKRFVVFEGTSGATIIGSGLTRTKAEQVKVLSYNTAKQIEDWLVTHPEWFPATGEPVPEPRKPDAAAAVPTPPTADVITATPLPATRPRKAPAKK
jgi:hypothetical protein